MKDSISKVAVCNNRFI